MSARFDRAVHEAFYWGERLDNGSTFSDFGEICSPGIDAALSGMWRGRNRADNEAAEGKRGSTQSAKDKEKSRQRYNGDD